MPAVRLRPGLAMTTRSRLLALLAVLTAGVALIPVRWHDQTFVERHRAEAETFCRTDPELKFRKYPLADGTDPAPHLDPFEYCIAAYISHLP